MLSFVAPRVCEPAVLELMSWPSSVCCRGRINGSCIVAGRETRVWFPPCESPPGAPLAARRARHPGCDSLGVLSTLVRPWTVWVLRFPETCSALIGSLALTEGFPARWRETVAMPCGMCVCGGILYLLYPLYLFYIIYIILYIICIINILCIVYAISIIYYIYYLYCKHIIYIIHNLYNTYSILYIYYI